MVSDDHWQRDEEDGETLDGDCDRGGGRGEETEGRDGFEKRCLEGVVGFGRVSREEGEEEGEEGESRCASRGEEGAGVEEEGLHNRRQRNSVHTRGCGTPWETARPIQ